MTNFDYAFCVNCIGSIDSVTTLVQTCISSCNSFLLVVQALSDAELSHHVNIEKISNMPLLFESGGLQDSLEQFRLDLRHKAAQHKVLAENLMRDIHRPILELVHQLYPKQKHLISQYDKITRDVKGIEDEYRKSWVKYEQAYFVAHMSYKECKSAGLSVKILDQTETGKLTSNNLIGAPNPSLNIDADDISDSKSVTGSALYSALVSGSAIISGALSQSSLASLTLAAKRKKGKDFLNWAMLTVDHKPLDYFSNEESGPDHMTHATIADDAATRAYEQLLTAEVLRGKCLEQWRELVLFTERSALKVQVVLSHLQGMVETVHMLLSDALRKMLVFSSSTLANLQYDVQMLFKVLDQVAVEKDLTNFMKRNGSSAAPSTEDRLPVLADILPQASHPSTLPPPPTDLPLTVADSPQAPLESVEHRRRSLVVPLLTSPIQMAHTPRHVSAGAEIEKVVETCTESRYCAAKDALEAVLSLAARRRSRRRQRSDGKAQTMDQSYSQCSEPIGLSEEGRFGIIRDQQEQENENKGAEEKAVESNITTKISEDKETLDSISFSKTDGFIEASERQQSNLRLEERGSGVFPHRSGDVRQEVST